MKPTIAEVSLPISFARDDVFDYLVPPDMIPQAGVGARALVSFRQGFKTGYITKIKNHSPYAQRLKPILKILDPQPLLDASLLALADYLGDHYLCSRAQALSTVLPFRIKSSASNLSDLTPWSASSSALDYSDEEKRWLDLSGASKTEFLVQDEPGHNRWPLYSAFVKRCLREQKSALLLEPTGDKCLEARHYFEERGLAPLVVSSTETRSKDVVAWLRAKSSPFCFVLGTRSAVLTPVQNPGLIIIDEEDHFAYHQEQVPYYRALDVARHRLSQGKGVLALGSSALSLEAHALRDRGAQWIDLGAPAHQPDIKIFDMHDEPQEGRRRRPVFVKTMEYRIADALDKNEKSLVYVPQKGFSAYLYCRKCRRAVTCPRCSASVRFSSKEKMLFCPLCAHRAPAQEICPSCQSAYVRYAGCGIEKVDQELGRLFPNAKVAWREKGPTDPAAYDIMLTTSPPGEQDADASVFDRTFIIGIDALFGHMDFRSSEKAFLKLSRLISRTRRELCLQTYLAEHEAMRFLKSRDTDGFMRAELIERAELQLPPATSLAILLIRAKTDQKARGAAEKIFRSMRKTAALKKTDILKPVAATPFKVRGQYRYNILIRRHDSTILQPILWKLLQKKDSGVTISWDPSMS